MAVVKELIRTEENGSISFGNYELSQKSKVSDYPHQGDMYKVKTFQEITKLERNGMFVYESVPGTAVFSLEQDGQSSLTLTLTILITLRVSMMCSLPLMTMLSKCKKDSLFTVRIHTFVRLQPMRQSITMVSKKMMTL